MVNQGGNVQPKAGRAPLSQEWLIQGFHQIRGRVQGLGMTQPAPMVNSVGSRTRCLIRSPTGGAKRPVAHTRRLPVTMMEMPELRGDWQVGRRDVLGDGAESGYRVRTRYQPTAQQVAPGLGVAGGKEGMECLFT